MTSSNATLGGSDAILEDHAVLSLYERRSARSMLESKTEALRVRLFVSVQARIIGILLKPLPRISGSMETFCSCLGPYIDIQTWNFV
jgi:hypothetical protein